MEPHDSSSTVELERRKPKASAPLLAAALSGLMGVAVVAACSDDPANVDPGGDGGTTYSRPILGDAKFSMSDFEALCESRQGFLYVNAACAGGAMCKGLSFHGSTLWEHSCRAQNSTCSGVGCLDMPKDQGLTGKQIYEEGPCANCHAEWKNGQVDLTKFGVLYYPPEMSESDALNRFTTSTEKRLTSVVAVGVSGIHKDGTPFANMPSFYQKYSLAEIRRVAAYLKTLQPYGHAYTIFGEDGGGGGH